MSTSRAALASSLLLGGDPVAQLDSPRRRLVIGMMIFAAVTAMLTLRLVQLGMAGRAPGGPSSLADLPPRGDIVDRNGVVLAQTIDAYGIAVRPRDLVADPAQLARELATLLPGRSPEQIHAALTSPSKFRYIQRRVLPADAKRVNALGEPGLVLEREPERLYPHMDLGAHVVGFTDIDGVGKAGVERAENERLSDPARRGEPLVLSIDARIQQAMEGELSSAMAKFQAIGAAGIVMDIHTGEVLAMASLPSFNPNDAGRAPDEGRFNRATQGVYELGSTFKAFTVAMAFEAGTVTDFNQLYNCTRPLYIGRFSINDTHPFRRWASVADIIRESSNIGTAQIARELGARRQQEFLRKLGFMEAAHIELKERGVTLTPGANWGEIATMTVGYGHGIAVSPLHLASGYATLANGGVWRPPTLLKVQPGRQAPGRRVFSEETSEKVRKLLRLVVVAGTGKKADAPGYRVGGKTGSAEKAIGGRYARKALVTNFAGVFPIDDPKYVVVAMLDEPKGIKETYGFRTAGWNVAPVVKQVVSRIGPMLGIEPDEGRDIDLTGLIPEGEKAS